MTSEESAFVRNYNFLEGIQAFRELNEQPYQKFNFVTKLLCRTAEKGEILIKKGEEIKYIYIVKSGEISLSFPSGQGILDRSFFRKGDIFGEIELFLGKSHSLFIVKSLVKSVLLLVERGEFLKATQNNAFYIQKTVVEKIKNLIDKISLTYEESLLRSKRFEKLIPLFSKVEKKIESKIDNPSNNIINKIRKINCIHKQKLNLRNSIIKRNKSFLEDLKRQSSTKDFLLNTSVSNTKDTTFRGFGSERKEKSNFTKESLNRKKKQEVFPKIIPVRNAVRKMNLRSLSTENFAKVK